MTDHIRDRDTDPALAELLESAYAQRVDMEVAARHLWMIHRAAGALRSPGVARTRKALVTMLVGSMFFMSSGGALAASSNALPGDVLYSVKRGVENARIVLTVSRQGDARLHLALAKRRMSEARAAAAKRPEVVPDLVRDALDSIEVAERTGGTSVAMEVQEARRETTEQLDVLVAVLDETDGARIAGDNRKLAGEAESLMLLASEEASPSSSPEASPSASTEPSSSPSASADPSPSTSPGEETSSPEPSPSESDVPSESASPSPSATPSEGTSEAPSETASPTPSESATATPSESNGRGRSRKYESLDPTAVAEPEPEPEPEPSPAPAP